MKGWRSLRTSRVSRSTFYDEHLAFKAIKEGKNKWSFEGYDSEGLAEGEELDNEEDQEDENADEWEWAYEEQMEQGNNACPATPALSESSDYGVYRSPHRAKIRPHHANKFTLSLTPCDEK